MLVICTLQPLMLCNTLRKYVNLKGLTMTSKIILGIAIALPVVLLGLSVKAAIYTSRKADACAAQGGGWLARDQVCIKSDYILPVK